MHNPTTTTAHDWQFPFHDQAALPVTLTGCSECGTTLTGPTCVTCAQRADARPVDFHDYDDLSDGGWS